MKKSQTNLIIKNSTLIIVGRMLEYLLAFVSILMVARYLGVQKYGDYVLIRGLGVLLIPLISWGTMEILIREIAMAKKKCASLIPAALALHALIMAVVVVVVTIVFLFFFDLSFEMQECIYLVIIWQTFFIMQRSNTAVFIANEQIIYSVLLECLMRLLSVIMFGLVIAVDLKMRGLYRSLAFVYCFGFIMSWITVKHKGFGKEWRLDRTSMIYLIKESYLLFISQFIVHGYLQINIVVIKMFSRIEEISFYQIPQRIMEPLRLLPRSLMVSFLPSLSVLGANQNGKSEIVKIYAKLIKYILVFSLPICICVFMFAQTIISLLFGQDFMGAAIPLQISIWAIIPFSINIVQVNFLTALKHQNTLFVANGCCLIVNAILGILLIPLYGAIGASITMVLGLLILVRVNAYYIQNRIGKGITEYLVFFRLLYSCLALWIILWCFKSILPDVVLLPIGIIVYSFILVGGNFFNADEIDVISGLIKNIMSRVSLYHIRR